MAYGKLHYMDISFIMNSYSAIIHRYCSHYHVNQMYIYIYTLYTHVIMVSNIPEIISMVHRVCIYLC